LKEEACINTHAFILKSKRELSEAFIAATHVMLSHTVKCLEWQMTERNLVLTCYDVAHMIPYYHQTIITPMYWIEIDRFLLSLIMAVYRP